MNKYLRLVALFVVALTASSKSLAQDISALGGDLTSDLPGRHAIQVNAPNVTDETKRLLQLSGFGVFHDFFSKSAGLGPRFLAKSCGSCHVRNSRGPLRFSTSPDLPTTMVLKVGLRGQNEDGSPKDLPGIGSQIQDHSISGDPAVKVFLSWIEQHGSYPDGTRYSLRKPKLRIRYKDESISSRRLVYSLRMSPAVIGPGLLESIPDADINALSDPDDANEDGISGRVSIVPDVRNNTTAIGRFGFRATNPTVEQQSCGALFGDMGVSNPLFTGGDSTTEVSEEQLNKLVLYQTLAGVPRARKQDDAGVIAGKGLFQSLGCSSCHVMTHTTGTVADAELSGQTIHPMTDLLLHNMGPGLKDSRPEFTATGSEWRTTPLWGLGYSLRLSSGRTGLLHDGRARTIEEAILWHGGEAATSRRNFRALPKSSRKNLIKFLDSL